eukprot:scaffold369440_cov98-Attheya_sp.AAC.3
MSPPVSDAAASDDYDSSSDILGTTKVPGHPKQRRMNNSKAVAVPASLSTGIHPPAKKEVTDIEAIFYPHGCGTEASYTASYDEYCFLER